MKTQGIGSVADLVELSKIKRYKLFGRIALFAALMGFVHAIKDAAEGPPGAALIDVFITLVIISCYLLYRRGKIHIARIVGLTFLNLTFAAYASLLPATVGVFLFYFPMIAISAAVFDTEEWKLRYFFMSLSGLCLFALFVTDFKLLGDRHLDVGDPKMDFLINIASSSIVLIACVNFIIQIGRETEEALYELANEIKVKNISLEKTNAELDRFLYSTSHDLRSPLMSIRGLVNIAIREDDSDVVRQYLAMMRERTDKLDLFIKDIIDYARNSRTELECNEIDFNALVDEVWANYQFMEGADRIRIEKEISCEPICTDRARIVTLLNNLISNAVKYHNPQHSSPVIRVKISSSEKHARIVIEDNGIGIPKDRLGRVFDMFYRAHDYSKGSGLGLYIVKEVVDKLSGTIRVTSTPLVGTSFTLVIPVMAVKSEAPIEPPTMQLREQGTHSVPAESMATKAGVPLPQA